MVARIVDRRGRAAAPKILSRGGMFFYRPLRGEDATTIARYFGISPRAIPQLLRLNKRYLNHSGNLPRLRGIEEIRIPALWMEPHHAAFPSRARYLRGLAGVGVGDLFDVDDDQAGNTGNSAGGAGFVLPGNCPQGTHWVFPGSCPPDTGGDPNSGNDPDEGKPCGPGAIKSQGNCVCDSAKGFIHAHGDMISGECVRPGDSCGQDAIWNMSGECISTAGGESGSCCGGQTLSWVVQDPNGGCGITAEKQAEIDSAGQPECTSYDMCNDDFVLIPGCSPKAQGGSGTKTQPPVTTPPSGGGGSAPAKPGGGAAKPPPGKNDKAGGAATKAAPWSTGKMALVGAGLAAAGWGAWKLLGGKKSR